MKSLQWLAVTVGAVVLSGCGATRPALDTAAPSTDPPSTDPGSGYAANRAAAQREAARLLGLVSLPSGAVRTDRAPIPALVHACAGVSPADTGLTRTTWWTVPEPPSAVADWLRRHVPAGLAPPDGGGNCIADNTTSVDVTDWSGAGTTAYTAPVLQAEWTSTPDGTALRIDAFLAAREARTPDMRIPEQVSDVTITRTSTPTSGEHPRSHTSRRRVVDPTDTRRLISAIDALPAVAVSDTFGTGLAMQEMRTYQIRIDWPGHVMVGDLPTGGDLTLTLDGRRLAPDLEVGESNVFPGLLDELMQEAGPAGS